MSNTHQENNEEAIAPWYKQFWLWFLLFFPALAIVAGIYTIKIAVDNADSLVRDDYYKAGLAINEDLALDQATAARNITADLSIDNAIGDVVVLLQGEFDSLPAEITLDFIHPTIESKDFTLSAKHRRNGRYLSQLSEDLRKHWYLQVSDRGEGKAPTWRLKTTINLDNAKDDRFTLQLGSPR